MNNVFKVHLAEKFPALVFPDKAALRPGELIGYLTKIMQYDPACIDAAEAHLPKREEQH